MYCQTCGTEIQPGLNYCNRCGSLVNGAMAHETPVPVDLTGPVRWVSVTVGVTFLVGLSIIFAAIGGIASWGFNKDAVIFIALFGMVTLFGVEISLIRLLSRLLGVTKERGGLRQLKRKHEKEIAPPQPQYIQPAGAYAASQTSVTDHTTRTFTPAYREPRA
ncbi:MAG TPA: hypothetical protein VM864_02770 [Pyrinomonadaceae bacterium]|jgi:hypothetical protein|nr:hypothetical protein [Pyrinomonadaceae bacterium]